MTSRTQRWLRNGWLGKAVNDAAEKLAWAADRCLYKPHIKWWNDRSWLAPFSKYLDDTRILDRRFGLVQWVRAVGDLPGSTAECGVYLGVGSALICKALEGRYGEDELHFGFDSFEGLPAPLPRDLCQVRVDSSYAAKLVLGRPWRKGHLRSRREVAEARLREFAHCRLVQGWIPQCFEAAGERRYRFVHIDVDLYQPTLDSLQYFYPRLVTGGVILLDDHGLLTCPGARQAADEFFADKPETVVELATGQAVVMKK